MINHPVVAALPCVRIKEEWRRAVISTQEGDEDAHETVDAQLLYGIKFCESTLLFKEFTLKEMMEGVKDGDLEIIISDKISDNGEDSNMAANARRIMENKEGLCKAPLRKFALKKEGEGTWRVQGPRWRPGRRKPRSRTSN